MTTNNKIAIGVLLWTQAIFLGSTFGTWLPVVAATTLASLLVLDNHRRHYAVDSGRSLSKPARRMSLGWPYAVFAMLVILVVCLAWRLEDQTDAQINLLSVAIDAIAHWGLFCSALIWGLRPNRGHVAMLGLGMLVLLLGVAAGGTTRSMAAQTSIALVTCVGFTIATQIIQGTARGSVVNLFGQDNHVDDRTRWMARTISLVTVSLILMTSGVIANTTSRVLPGLQQAVQEQLSESLDVVVERTGIGGTRYARSGRLGAIREHMTASPTEVALVVNSASRPGYLRGRVYDVYRQQRWLSAARLESTDVDMYAETRQELEPSGDGTVKLKYPLYRPLQRFQLPVDRPVDSALTTPAHLVVYNNPVKGYIVFTPLAIRWIEARSRRLVIGEHDVIGPGVDITKPYVAGVGLEPRRDVLAADRRNLLTEVPEPIRQEATRLAAEIVPKTGSASTKASAVSRYFQSQWDYSLRPIESPPGVDPITFFLRQQHPAHCEYFASATAAVLRAANIPARYVTGYIVDELEEDEDDIWLARNRDAHAWVEAYDDQSERWFAVESTPGRTYQTLNHLAESRTNGNVDNQLLDDSVAGPNTLLGGAWSWLVSLRATDAMMVVYQFAQLPLFLFLVGFWWVKFRRAASDASNEIDVKSIKMLRQVDRTVRKHALTRRPSETLHQFADRIESDELASNSIRVTADLRNFANWYRQYANARYQGLLPRPLLLSS